MHDVRIVQLHVCPIQLYMRLSVMIFVLYIRLRDNNLLDAHVYAQLMI